MGVLRWAGKGVKYVRKKWRGRKEWNYNELTRPLMDETAAAAEGNLPNEYQERHSEWEEIPEATKDRAPRVLKGAADNYTTALDNLETAERKRIRLADRFITRLPDGEVDGNDVLFLREVHEQPGPNHHPHMVGEQGDFDQWLIDTWQAFEAADNERHLITEIEALARSAGAESLRIETIRYWEEESDHEDWAETLWDLYESGDLQAYHSTLQEIEDCKEAAMTYAEEMDNTLRSLN